MALANTTGKNGVVLISTAARPAELFGVGAVQGFRTGELSMEVSDGRREHSK